ncbi:MAG: TlpA family protein disulfide reductase [Acidobacteria bacterium]|nr:TlpA family protein disulfide reductase [Acidobacteriota bacterium]
MRWFWTAAAVSAISLLPLECAEIPRPAPELSFRLASGRAAKLSQFKGKAIALEFLLTTCSHCQQTSQLMARLQAEYGARGFQALGVAINDEKGGLTAEYVKQFQLKYPVGWTARREAVTSFLQHPPAASMMMPQLIFIDRQGTIRAQYAGTDPFFQNEEAGMRTMIEFLLGKLAPGKAK